MLIMKQLFQNLGNGSLQVTDVPCPAPAPGRLIIQAEVSLISAGTERMLLDFGRGSWLKKIKSQPDKVKQVQQKIKSDGLIPTLQAVRRKLAVPIPLGYSHVGRVLSVGPSVEGYEIGDLVLSNGNHSEIVSVPVHLCAKVPAGVAPDDAAFGVVGAIALQGIRLASLTLGEKVAVFGLGLIGQLTVQLLHAQGCEVLAIDLDPQKVAMAESFGATGCLLHPGDSPLAAAMAFTRGRGIDAVLITAATDSNAPLIQAAEMSRPRGRIILVGVIDIQAPRDLFYKKELTFQVSCSYGPGRYDPSYEEQGQDYPLPYVRWTEQRNFEAVLAQMAAGRVVCKSLITGRFPILDAKFAYDALLKNRCSLGTLLDYPLEVDRSRVVPIQSPRPMPKSNLALPGIAIVGSGQYTVATLLPALDKAPPHRRVCIVSRQGGGSALAAKQYHFQQAATDIRVILEDPAVHGVILTTRHNTHADLVIRCLCAGKHVFVEKPLATTLEELSQIRATMEAHPDLSVTVGFNRPWAPMMLRMKESLATRKGPLHLICEVNAGELPTDHWLHGPQGGGRLIGEGCHWIHLMRTLTDSAITNTRTDWIRHSDSSRSDGYTTNLQFADGSIGTLVYSTVGHKTYPKETYTAYWEGKVLRMSNFQHLAGWGLRAKKRSWNQDKGHAALLAAWVDSLGVGPIQDPSVILEVSEAIILANR